MEFATGKLATSKCSCVLSWGDRHVVSLGNLFLYKRPFLRIGRWDRSDGHRVRGCWNVENPLFSSFEPPRRPLPSFSHRFPCLIGTEFCRITCRRGRPGRVAQEGAEPSLVFMLYASNSPLTLVTCGGLHWFQSSGNRLRPRMWVAHGRGNVGLSTANHRKQNANTYFIG